MHYLCSFKGKAPLQRPLFVRLLLLLMRSPLGYPTSLMSSTACAPAPHVQFGYPKRDRQTHRRSVGVNAVRTCRCGPPAWRDHHQYWTIDYYPAHHERPLPHSCHSHHHALASLHHRPSAPNPASRAPGAASHHDASQNTSHESAVAVHATIVTCHGHELLMNVHGGAHCPMQTNIKDRKLKILECESSHRDEIVGFERS